MSHIEILRVKEGRLAKYTGGKLRRKQRALVRALSRVGLQPRDAQDSVPPTLKTGSQPPVSVKRPEPTKVVESSEPEWLVSPPGERSFKVRATSEKKARSEAREALKIRALVPGTKVERV